MIKLLLSLILVIAFQTVSAHSGGTDDNGCHAGSRPYHCHNGGGGGVEYVAKDLNLGIQVLLPGTPILPYLGISYGESPYSYETVIGFDAGFKLTNGLYLGYVSTSESVQLGYKVFHFSFSDGLIGAGIRIPTGIKRKEFTSLYLSGSGIADDS